MTGKPIDYLWAFIIGGLISIAAQLVLELFLAAGCSFAYAITFMLAVISALGGVFTASGHYQKLVVKSGFGAILPFSGFSAAISEFSAAALDEGKSFWTSAYTGLRGPLIVFAIGFPFAFIVALIKLLLF